MGKVRKKGEARGNKCKDGTGRSVAARVVRDFPVTLFVVRFWRLPPENAHEWSSQFLATSCCTNGSSHRCAPHGQHRAESERGDQARGTRGSSVAGSEPECASVPAVGAIPAAAAGAMRSGTAAGATRLSCAGAGSAGGSPKMVFRNGRKEEAARGLQRMSASMIVRLTETTRRSPCRCFSTTKLQRTSMCFERFLNRFSRDSATADSQSSNF